MEIFSKNNIKIESNNTVKIQSSTIKPTNEEININSSDVFKNDNVELSEDKKILKPLGKSNNQRVYFLYSIESPIQKILMREPNRLGVMDDIDRLRAKGYTVVVDKTTTTKDFKDAIYDNKSAGVVFLGHGGEGSLVTIADSSSTEGYVTHWDIEKDKVSKNLKFVYMQACQAGMEQKNWEKALGTEVIAWTKSLSNVEVISLNAPIGVTAIIGVGPIFSVSNQIKNKTLEQIIDKKL